MTTIFKISFGSDIRRVSVPSTTSFDEFNELVRKLFIDSIPEHYVIKYTDDESDLVSITCDRELREAFAFASGKPLLRLSLVEKIVKPAPAPAAPAPAAPQEQPKSVPPKSDPLVGIIEQALGCPELQGLISAFGVTPEAVRNIVASFTQPEFSDEKGKEKEEEKEEKSSAEACVHAAYCDRCDKQIVGIRYKCTVCIDFDLCSECEGLLPSASVHDPQHLFLKVFSPVSLPMRRPLLRNFYTEPAGWRRGWGGPGCGRGPWGGRRGCHAWRQAHCQGAKPEGTEETTPMEFHHRWQQRGQNWLSSRFIADVTINDGAQMEPRTAFHKVWKLKNTGNVAWPEKTALSFVAGDSLGGQASVVIDRAVQPGEEIDIGVNMVAPDQAGRYISNFRLVTPEGVTFGHRVWCDILVIPSPAVEEKKEEPAPVAAPEPELPASFIFVPEEIPSPVVEEKKEEPAPIVAEEKKEEPAPAVEEKKEEPAPVVDPDYKFAAQLTTLLSMGFSDVEANKAVLNKRKGNVVAAVTDLLA